MKKIFILLLVLSVIACSETPGTITFLEASLLMVDDSTQLSEQMPARNIFKAKKQAEWIGVTFMDETEKKFGLYNAETQAFHTYPPPHKPFPPLYDVNSFCLLEEEVVLMGGQIESIALTYDVQETKKVKIDHGHPRYWASKDYFDMWDNKMLVALALPPVDDFPGLFSFIEDEQPRQFLGAIPAYLKNQEGTYRDYPAFIADREGDQLYVKLQFDTLIHAYDLRTFREEKIPIPAPRNYQPEININKIESVEDAASMAAGKARKNPSFHWIKVVLPNVYYLYLHYDAEGDKVYTLYHYNTATNIVVYQDVTEMLAPRMFFQEDVIWGIDASRKLIEYRFK